MGHKVWILMKSEKEFVGTLRGFDDFVNVVRDGGALFLLAARLSPFLPPSSVERAALAFCGCR